MGAMSNASVPAEASGGRRRLMEAALRLSAQKRSVHAVGVRELGREAGLNPNTFYRHFKDMDDLGLAILDEMGTDLQKTLRSIRRSLRPDEDMAARTVSYVFEFAARNPDAFTVAVRELHGPSPTIRRALRGLLSRLAEDMVEDLKVLGLVPGKDEATLRRVALIIVQQCLFWSLESLEYPERREAMTQEASQFILFLFAGIQVVANSGHLSNGSGRSRPG